MTYLSDLKYAKGCAVQKEQKSYFVYENYIFKNDGQIIIRLKVGVDRSTRSNLSTGSFRFSHDKIMVIFL